MPAPLVTITLLGPPRVLRGGTEVRVDTRKATALLARLALDPDATITRDTAVDLLWPDAPLDNARNSLRRTLSVLRSAIGTDVVEADRASIRLIGEMIDLDVDRTAPPDVTMHDHREGEACPACVDALWEAHRAFSGEFMEGFSLRDAPPFDDWMLRTAEELTSRHTRILARLAEALLVAGRIEEAAEAAGRWIELDPLDESAHRRRIDLLGRLGNRSAASDQFAECARILDEELGVSPLPETVRLLDSILSGATHDPLHRIPAADTPPAVPAGFFGRDAELALVADAARRRSSMLVVGDPGVGKSRLVAEAATLVAAEGMPVATVRAVGGDASLPFLLVQRTLAEALEGFSGSLPESAAPALEILPDLRSAGLLPTSIPDGPLGRLRILDAVGVALDGLLGSSVLVIDDVHLADEDSLVALHHVLGRRARSWALVLVGQPSPQALALGDDTDDMLRLGPLGAEGVEAMVTAHLGSSDPALAEALLERTGGNPFFLEQCLRSTDPTTSVPSSVQASVERRLSALDPLAVQVLGVASVLRRPHPLDLIRRVSGRTEEETADAVDTLIDEGFLTADDTTFGIAHSIFADAVLASLRPARRALIHGRAADALATSEPVDHATVAGHLAGAGRVEEAALARWDAAMHALRVRAFAAAEDHLSHAVALGHPSPGAIAAHLGDLAMYDGRYEEARSHYEQALSHGRSPERLLRLAVLFRRWGRLDEAERTLRGLEGPQADIERARISLRRGDREAVPGLIESGLSSKADADPLLEATLLRLKGLVAPDPVEALAAFERAAGLAAELGDEDLLIAVENGRARRLLDDGRPEDALEPARAALELAGRIGDRHQLAALHSNLADVLHELGRVEESQTHQRAAASGFSDVGTTQWEPEVWTLTEW